MILLHSCDLIGHTDHISQLYGRGTDVKDSNQLRFIFGAYFGYKSAIFAFSLEGFHVYYIRCSP